MFNIAVVVGDPGNLPVCCQIRASGCGKEMTGWCRGVACVVTAVTDGVAMFVVIVVNILIAIISSHLVLSFIMEGGPSCLDCARRGGVVAG